MRARSVLLSVVLAAAMPLAVQSADTGPSHAVRDLRAQAPRLLARDLRRSGVEPKTVVIDSIAVSDQRASVSWHAGDRRGEMLLVHLGDRWWLQAPTPAAVPAFAPIASAGGVLTLPRALTAAYDIAMTYTKNDAAHGDRFTQLYARAPTPAEMLPYPTPYQVTSDAVCFFDIALAGQPVTFSPGTTIAVWFPFVLDDRLRYGLSYTSGGDTTGPVYGTIFDNTLHFELPAVTIAPDQPFTAEIDGF